MRSTLLVSAAVLVAGLAMASAQNAPGGVGLERDKGSHPRGQGHRAPDSAARNAAQPPQARSNDASVLPPRGRLGRSGRDGMAGDRSIWDRATAQGRLRPEQDRARPGRRQPAPPLSKERGQQDDLTQARTPHRPSDQGSGQAGGKLRGAPNQVRSVASHPQRHRSHAPMAAADKAEIHEVDIRKVQEALNQQGLNVGDPDGKLGRRTRQALIAFQKQRGFHTTGKADRTTLHALMAGAAAAGAPGPGAGPDNGKNPVPAEPQSVVGPSTTGQGSEAPQPAPSPQPAEEQMPPAPDGLRMPDTGATGRVPAGSPQEDFKEEMVPPGSGDQR